MNYARVTLLAGREKPIINGSPWVFSGSVEGIEECDTKGQLCKIFSAKGDFLCTGYVNPESKITCRVLSQKDIEIDKSFFEKKIRDAFHLRESILDKNTDSCRLINSEGDFLPGLIVDKYADGIVVQFLTCGMENFRNDILDILKTLLSPSFIMERSDTGSRKDEKLDPVARLIYGENETVEIKENGMRFKIDMLHGQKSGFYIDQRDSRHMIRSFCKDKAVLNLFSYTGGFSVSAAKAGAEKVVSVDSSALALSYARENIVINGLENVPCEFIEDDVFHFLNRDERKWDFIVLDPPAFATKKSMIEKASRGYKDLNMRALRKLNPGGFLFTFSCSHHIGTQLFRQIVYSSVVDSGRNARIIMQTHNQIDHPFNACHVEGEYLKGLLLQVAG